MKGEAGYWAALHRLPGIGQGRLRRVAEVFGSAARAWDAGPKAILAACWGEGRAASVVSSRLEGAWSRIDPLEAERSLTEKGYSVLIRGGPGYPKLLALLDDSPQILYALGQPEPADDRAVAVVGTRRADHSGIMAAGLLARGLAVAGVTTVSGLARGIDSAAHRGALQGGGRTIAVLGCGLDHVYPPENAVLRQEIAQKGIVLSELPPETPPKPVYFPWRNRLISGLSLGVVVVQAGVKSGALITADCALAQGREVFAMPGDTVKRHCEGSNLLLQQGAHVTLSAADVLDVLGIPCRVPEHDPEGREGRLPLSLSDNEKRVLNNIDHSPRTIDELFVTTGLPVSVLNATLVELEIKGLVRELPGSVYVLAES